MSRNFAGTLRLLRHDLRRFGEITHHSPFYENRYTNFAPPLGGTLKTRKSRALQVRLTPAQYEKLEQYAKSHEMSMSKVVARYISRLPWKERGTSEE